MRGNVRHHRKLFRRPDSGVWWAIYYDANGERRRESTHCSDRLAAEQWLRDAERRATSAKGTKASLKSFSYKEATAFFLKNVKDISEATWEMYRKRSKPLVACLGEVDINELTTQHLRDYIDSRKNSSHTIYKDLVTVRRVLGFCQKEGTFIGNLDTLMPEFSANYKPRTNWLSPEQYGLLALRLRPERRRWTDACVCLGGGRLSEISKLDWADFDWPNRRVHIRGTKTKRADRWVPIPELFYDAYHPIREDRGQFAQPWGKIVRDLALACRKAGIPKVSPNDLRRTYGSWLIQKGVDIRRVAALMGTSVAMVESVYGQFSPESLQAAVAQLPQVEVAAPKPAEAVLTTTRFGLLEID